jgi:acetyl-CoA C-acetyltransferase
VGRYGGQFAAVSAVELGAQLISKLISANDLDGADIDDVIFGQCYPNGEAPAIGRVIALSAGLPVQVGGMQLDRRCGSALQAICMAHMMVGTGVSDLVIAGGVESMSQAEHYATGLRWAPSGSGDIVLRDRLGRARVTAGGERYPVPGGMLETAENIRREFAISREEQDRFALQSHQRAVTAQDEGRFEREIVPIAVPSTDGGPGMDCLERDEHPRRDTDFDRLSKLHALRADIDSEATVTAGNSSGQNDGAAVCIVTTTARAHALGLRPIAMLRGWAVAGVSPDMMGLGPVPATSKVLDRLAISLRDLDVIELNEAFAAQVLGVLREWKLDPSDGRLNPNGSGISLGHPVGATGARILASLVWELERRDAQLGLETMCIGGGQGMAAVIERI